MIRIRLFITFYALGLFANNLAFAQTQNIGCGIPPIGQTNLEWNKQLKLQIARRVSKVLGKSFQEDLNSAHHKELVAEAQNYFSKFEGASVTKLMIDRVHLLTDSAVASIKKWESDIVSGSFPEDVDVERSERQLVNDSINAAITLHEHLPQLSLPQELSSLSREVDVIVQFKMLDILDRAVAGIYQALHDGCPQIPDYTLQNQADFPGKHFKDCIGLPKKEGLNSPGYPCGFSISCASVTNSDETQSSRGIFVATGVDCQISTDGNCPAPRSCLDQGIPSPTGASRLNGSHADPIN